MRSTRPEPSRTTRPSPAGRSRDHGEQHAGRAGRRLGPEQAADRLGAEQGEVAVEDHHRALVPHLRGQAAQGVAGPPRLGLDHHLGDRLDRLADRRLSRAQHHHGALLPWPSPPRRRCGGASAGRPRGWSTLGRALLILVPCPAARITARGASAICAGVYGVLPRASGGGGPGSPRRPRPHGADRQRAAPPLYDPARGRSESLGSDARTTGPGASRLARLGPAHQRSAGAAVPPPRRGPARLHAPAHPAGPHPGLSPRAGPEPSRLRRGTARASRDRPEPDARRAARPHPATAGYDHPAAGE